MKKVIFTDLDGTLLDENYSYDEAQEALDLIKIKKIPLVVCTSKTRAEIEVYRRKLNIDEPFISENGGAIFIPSGYFSLDFDYVRKGNYDIIEFGKKYSYLKKFIEKVKEKYEIITFDDLSVKGLVKETNLSEDGARRAKNREYDMVFKIINKEDKNKIIKMVEDEGLNYTEGGNYCHIMGDNDKGKAVKRLIEMYGEEFGDVKTIGFGDADNDKPMLDEVDKGFMVEGPEEWNEIVLGEIN